LRAFVRAEDGALTVFIVIMFVAMVGMIGLIIDVGRILNIHSQASSYVDRAALTAAAELDGEPGALQRAVRAAIGDAAAGPLIPTGFRLSFSGDNAVSAARIVFLSAITDDDADPYARSPFPGDTPVCEWTPGGGIDCGAFGFTQADADAVAAFALVEATTETEDYIMFPIAAVFAPGIATQASVAPQALAGFKQEICNIPPLAICNPYEDPGGGGAFTPIIGQQILLKMQGSGATWAPGNFGLLQMFADAGGNNCNGAPGSAAFIRCVLSLRNPNTRCISTRVNTSPGEKNTIHNGLNVRFDIYDPPLSRTNPATPPAGNVTKGKTFNGMNCQTNKLEESASTTELPFDSCFETDTCAGSAGGPRFGDGLGPGALADYWMTNHGAALPPALSGPGVTRYDAYRHEIATELAYGGTDNPGIVDQSAVGDENGRPTCSTATPITQSLRDRRVLTVAVMNCIQHGVQGNSTNIPVEDFLEIFLTHEVPHEGADEDGLFGEMLGVVEPGADDGILHEFPVLYR